MDRDIEALLALQSGVVARWQLVERGCRDSDIARLVRRRELVRVHEGVYVSHTGPLGFEERAWAAVLFCWPAALCHESAVGAPLGPRTTRGNDVHVAITGARRVVPPSGVRVHRTKDFDAVALLNLSPPRVRIEHAVLEVASDAPTERRAVGVLADACQARRTTAARLLARLDQLPRLQHRRLLREILADVAEGAFSVLERRYLRDVERPHGLPSGRRQRQVRLGRSRAFRDVEYLRQRLVVELDGRLGHEWAVDRWSDLDRDIAAAVDRRLTIRLGYGQVLEPCRVAAALGMILRARGWPGRPRACGPTCLVDDVDGDIHAPGEGMSPRIA